MTIQLCCARCGAPLNGDVDTIFDLTICPNCGKKWQLTPDRMAIVTTTLEIHDVTHTADVPAIGD